jgi:4-diphosphocytidyl-2-C-methyl-D-erythritol kinase
MRNIFQQPVFTHYPDIATAHQKLVNAGAEYAAMSGTGSTCFGLFANEPAIDEAPIQPGWTFRKWLL